MFEPVVVLAVESIIWGRNYSESKRFQGMGRECHTQVHCSYALSHYFRKGNACRRVQVRFRSSTLTQRIGLFSFKHSSSVSHASPKESTQCNFPFYSIVYLFDVTTPLQLLKVHKTKRYPQKCAQVCEPIGGAKARDHWWKENKATFSFERWLQSE